MPVVGFLRGPLATTFGGIGLAKANRAEATNNGMAVAGLVLGIITMAVWPVDIVVQSIVRGPTYDTLRDLPAPRPCAISEHSTFQRQRGLLPRRTRRRERPGWGACTVTGTAWSPRAPTAPITLDGPVERPFEASGFPFPPNPAMIAARGASQGSSAGGEDV